MRDRSLLLTQQSRLKKPQKALEKTSSAAPESTEHTAAGQWRPWQRRAEFNGSPSTLSDVSVPSAHGQEHAADSKWWPGPRARESAAERQNCLVNCSRRGLSRWQPSSSELRATRCDWRNINSEHIFITAAKTTAARGPLLWNWHLLGTWIYFENWIADWKDYGADILSHVSTWSIATKKGKNTDCKSYFFPQ